MSPSNPATCHTAREKLVLVGGHGLNPELGGINLHGADLRNGLVMDVNLEGANLGRINAEGSVWIGVDLRGTEWTGANLTDACFYGCRLEGSQGLNSPLRNSSLEALLASQGLDQSERLREVLQFTLPRLRNLWSSVGCVSEYVPVASTRGI